MEQNVNQNQVTSLLIKANKKRLQNTIDHYHRNLPPTYMETKRVVEHTKRVKDIRGNEIKNTMFVNPLTDNIGIPISSQTGEIADKGLYIIPDFLNVSHRKKMNKLVFDAYSNHVSKNKKNRDLQAAHTEALQAALMEINYYIKWVEKNNDRLVKKFPDQFSYRSNEQDQVIPETEETNNKGFINKIKKIFTRGN